MRQTVFLLLFLLSLLGASGQETDSLVRKLDSLSRQTDSADGQVNNTVPAAYSRATRLTFKTYFVLLGSDIKQAYTKPFHMKGRDWGLLGKYALVTAALSFADKPVQRQALQWRNESTTLRNGSGYITDFGGDYEMFVLGSLAAYGYLFKNEKMRNSTLLASQSYITSALVAFSLKFVAGRQRPYILDDAGQPHPHKFFGPFSRPFDERTDNQSFPSGHTTAAFAAATVYALEYRNKPWVPVLAYSAASLIGLSRISENKHWATDVLAGAALGYVTGRLVVNNYHRYAQIKAPATAKGSLSFNYRYAFGRLMPGLLYKFR